MSKKKKSSTNNGAGLFVKENIESHVYILKKRKKNCPKYKRTLKISCKINIYIIKCPAIPNTIQYYCKRKKKNPHQIMLKII